MLRTLLALGLLMVSVAQAEDLTLQKRMDRAWTTPGWSVYTHAANGREFLVGFNRLSLAVEILSPVDLSVIQSTRLDASPGRVGKVATLSARTGEFLIAFVNENAKREQVVEVHTVNNVNSFSVLPDARVLALDLVESKSGDIYVVVQTAKGIERYERFKDSLRTAVLEEFEDPVNPGGNRVQGAPRATWSLAPARSNLASVLTITESRQPAVQLHVGDARQVREVSTFILGDRRYFAYVANDTQLTLQTGDAVFPLRNSKREVISSVRLVPSVRAFAIVLEGKKGSHLMMVEAR